MSFSPQKLREMVMQLLFSTDMGDSLEGDLIPFLMRELAISRKQVRAAYHKARAIWDMRNDLDQIIAKHSREYALERIQKVERNVLRLALFELNVEKVDTKVVIAEAIRLCRKFATPEASAFINALLDEITVSVRAQQTTE